MKSIKEYISEWSKENSIQTYAEIKNSSFITPESLGMSPTEAKIYEDIKNSDIHRLKTM